MNSLYSDVIRHAYGIENLVTVAFRMRDDPARLTARHPDDQALVNFINQCIAIERVDRPSSIAACLDELEHLRQAPSDLNFFEFITGKWHHTWKSARRSGGEDVPSAMMERTTSMVSPDTASTQSSMIPTHAP